METYWIAIVSLGIGLITHLMATVWWASRITAILEMVQKSVNSMMADGKQYATKEEVAEKFVSRDQQITAIWKKVDFLAEKS